MGSTTCLTIRVQPAPEQAEAWLAEHRIEPGSPVLQNLIPETCEDCGGEPSHYRSEMLLCAACLPDDPRSFVIPETCEDCGGEPSHYRSEMLLCAACLPDDPRSFVKLVNTTPHPCDDCGNPATHHPSKHISCESCRQADHDNYRSLANSPGDGTSCYDPPTPAEQRDWEERYEVVDHDPDTGTPIWALTRTTQPSETEEMTAHTV